MITKYSAWDVTAMTELEKKAYLAWKGIKGRCCNAGNSAYADYGGRGITMCKKWRDDFEAFIADAGLPIDSGQQIDRINNDGNYEPGNVRWVSRAVNIRNRRVNVFIEIDGEKKCMQDWAKIAGVKTPTILFRLRNGWKGRDLILPPGKSPNIESVTIGGVTKTIAQWAKDSGMKYKTLNMRVRLGWAPEDLLKPTAATLTHNGRTMTHAEWCAETGVKRTTLQVRLAAGWSVAEALTP